MPWLRPESALKNDDNKKDSHDPGKTEVQGGRTMVIMMAKKMMMMMREGKRKMKMTILRMIKKVFSWHLLVCLLSQSLISHSCW